MVAAVEPVAPAVGDRVARCHALHERHPGAQRQRRAKVRSTARRRRARARCRTERCRRAPPAGCAAWLGEQAGRVRGVDHGVGPEVEPGQDGVERGQLVCARRVSSGSSARARWVNTPARRSSGAARTRATSASASSGCSTDPAHAGVDLQVDVGRRPGAGSPTDRGPHRHRPRPPSTRWASGPPATRSSICSGGCSERTSTGAWMPAARSSMPSCTSATHNRQAPAASAVLRDRDRGPVAVAVGLHHRPHLGVAGDIGGAARTLSAIGVEVDRRPRPATGADIAGRRQPPRAPSLTVLRGPAGFRSGRSPATSPRDAPRRPGPPMDPRPGRRRLERRYLLGHQGPDDAGEHVAGARGGEPFVAGGDEQHPPVGFGDDRRRAPSAARRSEVGGQGPGRGDAVGTRRASREAARTRRRAA